MQFFPTPLEGAYVIELEQKGDARGFFARFFCEREFAKVGLVTNFVQGNDSLSAEQGTLRGMHYQLPPRCETKLIRCIRGALWDCILDLREDSPTFRKSFGAELTAESRRMMYCPKGFAHGFVTLQPDTEVVYLVDAFYSPDHERGVRWDDPTFSIEWPIEPQSISDKDRSWPYFDRGYRLDSRD